MDRENIPLVARWRHGAAIRFTPRWLKCLALFLTGSILALALGSTLLWRNAAGKTVPSTDPYALGYERVCDRPELGAPAGRLTYGLRVPTGRCLHYAWLCRSYSGRCPVPAGYAIAKQGTE